MEAKKKIIGDLDDELTGIGSVIDEANTAELTASRARTELEVGGAYKMGVENRGQGILLCSETSVKRQC